jgi:FAD/FMN-containing dehydrogenase
MPKAAGIVTGEAVGVNRYFGSLLKMDKMHDLRSHLEDAIADPTVFLDAPEELSRYGRDWTGKFQGETPLVLRPNSTEQVQALLAVCHRKGIAVVPQGGNTGLVGGSVPRNGEVVLSLSRLNAIEGFDEPSASVTVQAGTVLEALQGFLAGKGQMFPVDLGARGSCQIGGMIATNAGGIKVLRYGHMREQVLGLEVVLADGTVLSNLNRLRKNNTGLDLKQLFIGSEGILGVITCASAPRWRSSRRSNFS